MDPDGTVEHIHLQLLTGGQFQLLTDPFGDYDLKFRRQLYDLHIVLPRSISTISKYATTGSIGAIGSDLKFRPTLSAYRTADSWYSPNTRLKESDISPTVP